MLPGARGARARPSRVVWARLVLSLGTQEAFLLAGITFVIGAEITAPITERNRRAEASGAPGAPLASFIKPRK